MDEIAVTLPRERPFAGVAGLVLGGVCARHELTLDVLDDLQIALETLLEQEESDRELNVVVRIDDVRVEVAVGPFAPAVLAELDQEPGEELGLRRLLDAMVDEVSVDERTDGWWVELRKGYALASKEKG